MASVSALDWVNRPWNWLMGFNDLNRVAGKVKDVIEAFLVEHAADGTHSGTARGAASYGGYMEFDGSTGYDTRNPIGSFTESRLAQGRIQITLGAAYSDLFYQVKCSVHGAAYYTSVTISSTTVFIIEIYDDVAALQDADVSWVLHNDE